MNLAKFPRRRYTAYETPIEFLPNFTKALGGPLTAPEAPEPIPVPEP